MSVPFQQREIQLNNNNINIIVIIIIIMHKIAVCSE